MFDPVSPIAKLAERLYTIKPSWWSYGSASNCALRVAREMGIDTCLMPRIAYNAIFLGVVYDGNIDRRPIDAPVPTPFQYCMVEPRHVADALMIWHDSQRAVTPIEIAEKEMAPCGR